ncbi:hypothetical protein ACU4GD_38060 [Cupriavidus basilensis]
MKSHPTVARNASVSLPRVPAWMPAVLRLAALYNLLYAIALSLWPSQIFDWLGMPATPDAMIRCIGMMVGVYALGYWIAAQDMLRYWPLVGGGPGGQDAGAAGLPARSADWRLRMAQRLIRAVQRPDLVGAVLGDDAVRVEASGPLILLRQQCPPTPSIGHGVPGG